MKAAERLVAAFLLVAALLVWPLLAIPNRRVLILGVPALVAYLFTLWGLVVLVLWMAARRGRVPEDAP
jgi:hypothetical protein